MAQAGVGPGSRLLRRAWRLGGRRHPGRADPAGPPQPVPRPGLHRSAGHRRLERAQLPVAADDPGRPGAGAPQHRVLPGQLARHQMLLSADTAAYVPLLIHSLAAAKDQPAAVAAVIRHLLANGLLPSSESQSVIGYPIRCAEPWGPLPACADPRCGQLPLPGHRARRAVVAVRLHAHTRARRCRRLRTAATITRPRADDQRHRRPARLACEHVRSAADLARRPPADRTRPIPQHESSGVAALDGSHG